MKRLSLVPILLLSFAIGGCMSSTGPTTTPSMPPVDAAGNVYLDPPPAGEGIQLVYGPFDVPLHEEVQLDNYFKLQTTDSLYIQRIEIATNDGTHHMNLFRSFQDHPDTTEANFNSNAIWNSSDLLIECQQHYINWELPTGAAVVLGPRAQMILQVHYANAITQTTPNGKGKVVINLWTSKQKPTTYASMLFASNPRVVIAPHSSATFSKFCDFAPAKLPIQILSMTGHFHSRGKQFTVERWSATGDTSLGVLYKSTAWAEPPFVSYHDNPITINPGELIKYTCDYVNTTDSTIVFGPKVDWNEHSNLFVWFMPGLPGGQTIYDSK